jgi:cysteinyl-tRNA synthetase
VLPTWHIASAAAAIRQAGCPVDIQVSSVDFLFPHLENVRVTGEALTGKRFANNWLLCERLWAPKEESSELSGELSIAELTELGYSPVQIRYWLLSAHYRKPVRVGLKNLESAARGLQRLEDFITRLMQARCARDDHPALPETVFALESNFFDSLADDLNLPGALAALFQFVRKVNPLLDRGECSEAQRRQIFELLGRINGVLGILDLERDRLNEEARDLLERREEARNRGDFETADRLRRELRERGIRVTDTPQGPRWERTEN